MNASDAEAPPDGGQLQDSDPANGAIGGGRHKDHSRGRRYRERKAATGGRPLREERGAIFVCDQIPALLIGDIELAIGIRTGHADQFPQSLAAFLGVGLPGHVRQNSSPLDRGTAAAGRHHGQVDEQPDHGRHHGGDRPYQNFEIERSHAGEKR